MEERYVLTAQFDHSNLPPRPLEHQAILLALKVRAFDGHYAVTLAELIGLAGLDPKRVERILKRLAADGLVMIVKPLI